MNELFCEKLKSPLVVFWELTRKCNLKCRHCYTHSGDFNQQLSYSELLIILNQILSADIFSLGIGGGEPLLVAGLEEIIKKASENNIDVSLSTNGLLLTDKKAKMLKDAGIKLVQVSVDGLSSTHDYIRGQGSFEKAIRAIKILKRNQIITRLAFTVNKINYREIKNVFFLGEFLGVDWFIAFRYMTSGRSGDKIALNSNELLFATKTLIEIQENFPLKVFFEKLLFLPFLINEKYMSPKACNAGTSILNITANGDITPCPHVRSVVVGNILKDDLMSVWHNNFLSLDDVISEKCQKCKKFSLCGGGCKGVILDNNSDKDPLCWI